MFNLFGSVSPFDNDVEKATSETNTTEQWDLIIDICDKAGASSKNAKDCIRSILKRIGNNDPHVAIQGITLLDSCIKNCGRLFHLEIASRDFETEFQRIMNKTSSTIAQKMRISLKKWAENEFKTTHELNLIPSLYQKLRIDGFDFSEPSEIEIPKSLNKDPNTLSSLQEEEDIAKAIELSLKDRKNSDSGKEFIAAPNLYPNMIPNDKCEQKTLLKREGRKVRALYDFEAAEENEITFFTGEVLYVRDDSDPNWWVGYNDRGEGLFPSNFVTDDLNVIDQNNFNIKSRIAPKNEDKIDKLKIDEIKIDRLLFLIHEANPEDPSQDSEEMYELESEVNQMFPLIDTELEIVDRHHAKLTQLSTNLVEAINMYHLLMRDSDIHSRIQIDPHVFSQTIQRMSGNSLQPNFMTTGVHMGTGPSIGIQQPHMAMNLLPTEGSAQMARHIQYMPPQSHTPIQQINSNNLDIVPPGNQSSLSAALSQSELDSNIGRYH